MSKSTWRSGAASRATRASPAFAEKPNNIACWQRFADHHRGIALRFECGEDTGLPKPQSVILPDHAPVVTNRQEQLEIIYGRRNAPTADEFPAKLLIKGRHDHLEQEWRCFETAPNSRARMTRCGSICANFPRTNCAPSTLAR